MAHWRHRKTNAFLDGLNSVFATVKRKAYSFRSTKNLITLLGFNAAIPICPLPTENSGGPKNVTINLTE